MSLCVYTCFVYPQPSCVTLDFKPFIDSIHILFLLYLLLWFWDFTITNLQDFIKIYRALIKAISLTSCWIPSPPSAFRVLTTSLTPLTMGCIRRISSAPYFCPLSQRPVRLKTRKQYQRPITFPAPSLTMLRVISINFRKSKDYKESIILKYLQEGYDIILCQELNSPPKVPRAFASGMNGVRIYHNTTGRACGAAVVVGPSLSRYSQPLPVFKDAPGLLAACTVTPLGLCTLAITSVHCPRHGPTDPALYRDTLEALLPRLAAKYPLHLLGGDFNALLDPSMDSEGVTTDHTWE